MKNNLRKYWPSQSKQPYIFCIFIFNRTQFTNILNKLYNNNWYLMLNCRRSILKILYLCLKKDHLENLPAVSFFICLFLHLFLDSVRLLFSISTLADRSFVWFSYTFMKEIISLKKFCLELERSFLQNWTNSSYLWFLSKNSFLRIDWSAFGTLAPFR